MTNQPVAFLEMLTEDIRREERAAKRKGVLLVCRLNMVSDVPFEREFPELFSRFPDVKFVDYTKEPGRMFGDLPPNYHLTFSRSERNEAECLEVLAAGKNVAVVFRSQPYPETFYGYPVIEGESHDFRFLDPSPSVVGLRPKGSVAKRDATGFVVDLPAN